MHMHTVCNELYVYDNVQCQKRAFMLYAKSWRFSSGPLFSAYRNIGYFRTGQRNKILDFHEYLDTSTPYHTCSKI